MLQKRDSTKYSYTYILVHKETDAPLLPLQGQYTWLCPPVQSERNATDREHITDFCVHV